MIEKLYPFIDLYHIYILSFFRTGLYIDGYFRLMVRVIYKERRLFVQLEATTHYGIVGSGQIFITSYVNTFFNVTLQDSYYRVAATTYHHYKDQIFQSMVNDGYSISDYTQYLSPPPIITDPPRKWKCLKSLCYMVVKKNKTHLRHYSQMLPKILKESVDEFIQIHEAVDVIDAEIPIEFLDGRKLY